MLANIAAARPTAALTIHEHIDARFVAYEAAATSRGSRPVGVLPTGLANLDAEIEGGLHPGDLVILAAETSGGKTALAVQLAAHAAITAAAQVLVASYEMTAGQLTDRLIALATNIPSSRLRSGVLSEYDFSRLTSGVGPLSEAGIHLRDQIGHWTVDDVCAEARALKAQGGLHLLVVDYLQLAAPRPAARGSQKNREREVAEISRALKGLTKDYTESSSA